MRTLTGFALMLFACAAAVQTQIELSTISPITLRNPDQGTNALSLIRRSTPLASATWMGVTSTDWHTSSNWDVGAVPLLSTAVTIPAGTTYNPSISTADASVASVIISSGATLSIAGAFNLNIENGGSFTSNGTFNGASSTIIFSGAGTINGSSQPTFNNITINGNLTVSTTPTINGNFTINNGTVSAAPIYGSSSTLIYNTSAAT
ncbi:MAG TPA: hypothetical protein VEV83_19050, partial [Parafilimonas sp.]|nr:hypothetical protein [Parafilimonas sp.]